MSRRKKRRGLKLIAFVLLLLCAVVLYQQTKLDRTHRERQAQYEQLQLALEQENQKSALLSEKRAYMQTDRYIEDIARDILGLVYPDEILLKPAD